MPLQYISDTAGNHTAVIIPITDWELLTRKHEDLKQMEQLEVIEKDQFDFDFEEGLTLDQFTERVTAHIKSMPWKK